MAKQLHTAIKGKIDDYSFYHNSLHGYLVRKTGGVTSRAYHTDERYAATRDASYEFTAISKAGKLIRDAFSPFIDLVKDGSMVNRLNKELVALKQLDIRHERGKRKPETMMGDVIANKWLRIFQFNDGVSIYDLLEENSTGTSFAHLSRDRKHEKKDSKIYVPAVSHFKLKDSGFPKGATHAGITVIKSTIDFEKGSFETDSSQMVLISKPGTGSGCESSPEVKDHISALNCVPGSAEIEIVCLQVLFFEEKDCTFVPLKGKVHSMGIVQISKTERCKPRPPKKLFKTSRKLKASFYPIRFRDHLRTRQEQCQNFFSTRPRDEPSIYFPSYLKNKGDSLIISFLHRSVLPGW